MTFHPHGNNNNHSQLLTNVTGVVNQNAPDIVMKFCCEFSNSEQLLFGYETTPNIGLTFYRCVQNMT